MLLMATRIVIGPHLSHGFYRVSDAVAGQLAKNVDRPLPRVGYALIVGLPAGAFPKDSVFHGAETAELSRTPMTHSTSAPKRGWVWAVMPRK